MDLVFEKTEVSYRLLIRRSLVRAQVGEPNHVRPAGIRAVSFCSAIRALLRQFDDLINTETRGTSVVRKLLKSFEATS